MRFSHEKSVSNNIETQGQQYLFNSSFNGHFQVAINFNHQKQLLFSDNDHFSSADKTDLIGNHKY